jgi:hypothetical protein
MKAASHIFLWCLAILTVAILHSCRKDLDKISTSQWQPELAAPFINSEITLRNLIGSDSNLITTPDSLLVYYYAEDSVLKLTADSVIQPPEEIDYTNKYTIGEISVSDDLFTDTLTMNEMLNSIDEAAADSLRKYDGTSQIFPPFELQEPISEYFRPSQQYAFLTFSDGTIDITIQNILPVPLEDISINLVDVDFNQELKTMNISRLEPGESYLDSVMLGGLTIGNEFLMELTYYKTPGSFPDEVPINLEEGIYLSLLIDNAKVIAGEGKISEQIVVNTTEMIEYKPEEGEKIFNIILSEGDLFYQFTSQLSVDAEISITFPTAMIDGNTVTGDFQLPKGTVIGNQESAAGMSIDFTSDMEQPYNRFPVEFVITLLPSDEWVTIDSSDFVDAVINFREIGLGYADGYLGRKEVSITRDTVETGLEWLGDLEGEIILTEPVITIDYSNSLGLPMKVLPEIFGYNSRTGESQGLDSDTITIDYPATPGNVATGSFGYNNANSSLVDLIAIRPDNVIYDGAGYINWNEPDFNFVYDTSVFFGNAEVRIPLIMKSSFFSFSDTAKINVGEVDNSLKEGLIIANVLNGFPFEMNIELRIPDSISGEILETVDLGSVASAMVDAEGKVTEPVAAELTGAFDEDFLNSLTQASYALVYVESATFNEGTVPVSLHADYSLVTALGFQITIQP